MREVKIAEYWQRQEKRTRPISSHLERTRLVNKGFIRQRTLFSRGTQQGCLPFDQNSGIFETRANFLRKFRKNPEIVEFPKKRTIQTKISENPG